MENCNPLISRRVIGNVNIFDLMGSIDSDHVASVSAYLDTYIKEFKFNNVLVNVCSVDRINANDTKDILDALKKPKKKAIFFESEEMKEAFLNGYKMKKLKMCNSVDDVVKLFSKEMVERNKIIEFKERRNSNRIKTALSARHCPKRSRCLIREAYGSVFPRKDPWCRRTR